MRSLFICFIFLFISTLGYSQEGTKEQKNTPPNNFQNNEAPVLEEKEAEEIAPRENSKKEREKSSHAKGNQKRDLEQASQTQQLQKAKKLENDYQSIRVGARSATTKSVDVVAQKKMDNIVSQLEQTSSFSSEFHKIKYINGNHDVQLFNHLKKAYAINPKDKEVLQLMISFYDIKGDEGRRNKICEELKAVKPFSKETYAYLKNVLNSIPKNGVLITHGSLDTYPLFILKEVDGFRKDVTIVSLDLLQSSVYRERLREMNFQIPTSSVVDTKFMKSFCELNEKRNIYLSLTIPKNYFKEIPSNIYITGLAFKYSKSTISNVLELKNNWASFDKSLFEKETKPNNESIQLISNYLLPLIVLKKQYEKEGYFGDSEAIGAYIQKISRWQNQEQKVQDILKN
jgi:hypothetical protein